MEAKERKIQILNLINLNKNMSVEELAKTFKISHSTIRRELNEMSKSGLIIRTHGGATVSKEISEYENKKFKNYNEKVQIARYAASLIKEGDFILLGSSSVSDIMATYITTNNVTITTNSLNIAKTVRNKDNCQLILLGGQYFKSAETIEGVITNSQINNMHFSKAFLGANGIDFDYGISTRTEIELNSKITAIHNSDDTYFLCEYTKFNKRANYRIAALNEIDHIITDSKLKMEEYQKYSNLCDIIIADNNIEE